MRTAARFAGIEHGAGHYESFYIKATRPGGGQGVWIRHTVHKRPVRSDRERLVWLTLFDADAPGPRATKATFGADELSAPDGAYIRIDGARARARASGGRDRVTGRSRRAGISTFTTRASPSTTSRTSASTTRRCRGPSSSPPIRALASTARSQSTASEIAARAAGRG